MSTTEPEPKAPPAPLWPKLLVALVLLAAIGFALRPRISRWLHPPARPIVLLPGADDGPPAATREVLAFLAPIAVGSSIGGADVVGISGVQHGLIHVVLRKDDERIGFAIGLANPDREALRVGPYAVYVWTPGRSVETTAALNNALVRSLRVLANRPAPPGLSPGEAPTTATLLPPPRVALPTDATLPTPSATVGPPGSARDASAPTRDR